MPEDDKPFWVVWKDDSVNKMSSDGLARLSADAESWANFFFMLARRRSHALMRTHNPNRPADREHFKVLWRKEGERPPTFASIK